jgi:NAD-dependent histone deacetylase SIR2
LYKDREKVDLLVIIGTSLKVAPVSEVLSECHDFPLAMIALIVQHIFRIPFRRYSSI